MRTGALALLLGIASGAVQAQLVRENERPIERPGLANLSGGLLLDSTVTVLGHEFFSAYADAWRELDGDQRYSVTVSEVPTAIQVGQPICDSRSRASCVRIAR